MKRQSARNSKHNRAGRGEVDETRAGAETSSEMIEVLLRSLDRSFEGSAWHGPTLMSSLRGVASDAAVWRPQPERHNIWELAVHAAYWKYRVCASLTDLPRGSFELKGSNFFERPETPTEEAWASDLELLRRWHERLRNAVGGFDPARLYEHSGRKTYSYEELIGGVAAHDVYHAGQIQLLKKLRPNENG